MNPCASIRERFFGAGPLERGNPDLEKHLSECAACRAAATALPLVDRALSQPAPVDAAPPSFDSIAFAARSVARSQRRQRSVRRSMPYVATGFAAAAAAAVVAFFVVGRPMTGRPEQIAVGGRIETVKGSRTASLESGALLRLESGAVALVGAEKGEEKLRLDSGIVSLEVPKLPQGHAISLSTPDAEVRVHGTRFQVVRDAGGTAVSVAEGLVEVRPSGGGRAPLFLRPGESTKVQPPEEYRRGLRAAALEAIERSELKTAEQQLESLLATDLGPAERAEAHALFAWSLAASGERRGAIERYRLALATLPEALRPLWADNAAAELALLLEQEAPAEAGAAWHDYLRRFPGGVHSARARERGADEER